MQAGYGKYKSDGAMDTAHREAAAVNVDACTFDRVVLYLEHVDRGRVPTTDRAKLRYFIIRLVHR